MKIESMHLISQVNINLTLKAPQNSQSFLSNFKTDIEKFRILEMKEFEISLAAVQSLKVNFPASLVPWYVNVTKF